ncbi:ATPase family AAA domain-containing protein 3-B [Colletotrichum siamense]|nr:ATPase family AAA domain-containing protein 3-B [Colletotrichum siamense]
MKEGASTDGPPALHSSFDGAPFRLPEEKLPAAVMASSSTMADPEAEKASFSPMTDSEGDRNIQHRLHELESKVGLVDIMYDLHKSTTEGVMHEQHDAFLATLFSGKQSFRWDRYQGELAFLRDSMFFMQRIRESYQVILQVEKQRAAVRRSRRKRRQNAIESTAARQISTKAFLNGERAKLSQADWDEFIADIDFEASILYPIEVVVGEPDSRTILQLGGPRTRKSRLVERHLPIDEDEETTRNRALPERIKIYSAPLMVIMSKLTNDLYWTSDLGGALMLLRPYQDLFYYNAPLRQWLARLEKDFDGFDGSIDPREVSADSGENDHNADGTGSPTCEGSVSNPAVQHVAVEAGNLGQSSIDHANPPRRNHDETSNRAEDDPESSDEDSDGDEGTSARELTLANSITALIHLRSLLEFIDNEIKPRQKYLESTMCSHVSFHDLWHLFNPGTEVIEQGGKQAFVVLRVEVPVHKIEEPWGRWSKRLNDNSEEQATEDRSHFTLHCASIDFDGKNFGPVSKAFLISPFGDLKPVTSLPIYPVRFKGQEARQNLIRRGRLLLEVADFKAMYYTGATLDRGDEIDSQVVIDFSEALADEKRVFGFVLRSRKWAQLDLNLLRYENSNARDLTIDAFERLELPEGHRELVQSLVTQHFRNRHSSFTRDEQTDLIQGKGKGLIMLLHGAPGVGKTTTAEGIAELFRKPLFQITCGDLGTTAKEVEEDLERSFALASRWGCILLLDEADVFLAARSKNDFARNGLVAVFLRVLEYYTGILFLTTNRIGDLDEAFASRIQMSLHYPELDELKTLKVFRLHLDLIEQRFKQQNRTITFDISSVEDFASQHYADQPYNRWNGRQIRNACHTALALAEFDAQKNGSEINLEIDKSVPVSLQLKYFKIVQKAYLDFGEYLADIQGTEGDDRAFQQRLRARKNTPFEKQSLFDSRTGPGQRRRSHQPGSRLSDMSPSFNTKTGSFHDDQHRHQRQYSSAASSHLQGYGNVAPYSQTAGGSFRDYGNAPAHSQHMHDQQAQTDTRFPIERQQAPLYESPQAGLQPAHSGEAHLHPSMSHDGSPLPHRPAQPQSMQYGYSSELQAEAMRSTTPRVQSDPRDTPHSGYTYRDEAQGGPSRNPYQGSNMHQT